MIHHSQDPRDQKESNNNVGVVNDNEKGVVNIYICIYNTVKPPIVDPPR